MAEGKEHKKLKNRIEEEFQKNGYETEKERRLENGLIVDVYAENSNETVLIEVGTLNGHGRIDQLKEIGDRVIHLPQIGKPNQRKYGSDIDSVELDYVIRPVRQRNDGVKYVTVPKNSDINSGDYVKIQKVSS